MEEDGRGWKSRGVGNDPKETMMKGGQRSVNHPWQRRGRTITSLLSVIVVFLAIGCGKDPGAVVPGDPGAVEPVSVDAEELDPGPTPTPTLGTETALSLEEWTPETATTVLAESWAVYKSRFIQVDGRVIDREAQDRTVSEGQAYAMLRAVVMDDPETFEATLSWAETNLQRLDGSGDRMDQLWAWQWGQKVGTIWGILDENFASDADLDAATALILAAKRWDRPDYLTLAQAKLVDLWTLSTVRIPKATTEQGNDRYFLPGPRPAFQQGYLTYLNPSYFAPYSFRLFAEVDPERDWLSLVDTSYDALTHSAQISAIGLPSDWVGLDITTGKYQPLAPSLPLRSIYSFDAYRVWWRVSLDYLLFDAPEAKEFLDTHLATVAEQWQTDGKLAATINRAGEPMVDYEATGQYAMLYPAFRIVDGAIADELLQQKLLPAYQNGIWDNDTAYYTQNLAWFGLASTEELASVWLESPQDLQSFQFPHLSPMAHSP